MKKLTKEYELSFIAPDVAVDRKDYAQLIGNAADFSLLKVSHGPTAADLKEVTAEELQAVAQFNDVTQNFEVNLVGLKKFIKVEGAGDLALADKGDVHEVSSKGVPVPADIRPVKPTDSTKI